MNYACEHKPVYFMHPDDLRVWMANYGYEVDFVGPPRFFYSIMTAGTDRSPDNPLVLNSYAQTTRIMEYIDSFSADGALAVQVDIHKEFAELRFVSPTLVPFRLLRKSPNLHTPAMLPHMHVQPPELPPWESANGKNAPRLPETPPRSLSVSADPPPVGRRHREQSPVRSPERIAGVPPQRGSIVYPERKFIGYSGPKLLHE